MEKDKYIKPITSYTQWNKYQTKKKEKKAIQFLTIRLTWLIGITSTLILIYLFLST